MVIDYYQLVLHHLHPGRYIQNQYVSSHLDQLNHNQNDVFNMVNLFLTIFITQYLFFLRVHLKLILFFILLNCRFLFYFLSLSFVLTLIPPKNHFCKLFFKRKLSFLLIFYLKFLSLEMSSCCSICITIPINIYCHNKFYTFN